MNKESNRIIGDILEINADIANMKTISSKFVAFFKEKYYRRRLNKIIKVFKNKKIILNKFNVQEIFYYLNAYNIQNYKSLESLKVEKTIHGDTRIIADLNVIRNSKGINDIHYVLNISDREENMNILTTIHYTYGLVSTFTTRLGVLFYFDIGETNLCTDILNDALLEILEGFLEMQLERLKKNKGYVKKVNI